MRPRPLEIRALVPLLKEDWETPELLAQALIEKLDRVRSDRTTYVAIMQFGAKKPVFYEGIGPFPGAKTAQNALAKHPGRSMATAIAVVPIRSPEGLEALLKEVG